MRNWNTLFDIICKDGTSNCQPTYEELKRGTEVNVNVAGTGLPAYLWGIETIEEKADPPFCAVIAGLPMRNWNELLKNMG